MKSIFTLRAQHLLLAKHINWQWQTASYGGSIEQYCKRPYGNSNMEMDIAKILGWPILKTGLTSVQMKMARNIHEDMLIAVPIILCYGQVLGTYILEEGVWQPFAKAS